MNQFQPSFKLASKSQDGAMVRKRYHAPATPYQRLLADPRTLRETRRRIETVHATLDPVRLLREIGIWRQRLVEITDTVTVGTDMAPTAPPLERFLAHLRTA